MPAFIIFSEANSGTCETSVMKLSAKIVSALPTSIMFAKNASTDFWFGSKYASVPACV